ncbi:lipocalin family protein [Spongiimicrobium sp. 3-5]|uniref:lipocalin family protein n=1 Tax=Spongiimicrobium sp. 3-5 TaxID=3332596 RepID=UPI0039806547
MMKKWFLLLSATVFLAASCSVSKSARGQRNLLSGTWSLNDISYENNTGNFKSVIFNDAEDICFEGSEWFFRDNNSTGRYTIQNSTLCSGGDRYIRWSVVERAESYNSQLQFKFIDDKRKDVSGLGYRLTIANLTETAMTLKSNVSVDGEPLTIVYQFTKK